MRLPSQNRKATGARAPRSRSTTGWTTDATDDAVPAGMLPPPAAPRPLPCRAGGVDFGPARRPDANDCSPRREAARRANRDSRHRTVICTVSTSGAGGPTRPVRPAGGSRSRAFAVARFVVSLALGVFALYALNGDRGELVGASSELAR